MIRSLVTRRLHVATLLLAGLLVVASAFAQSLPPPTRQAPPDSWDTRVLVNDAHNLTPEEFVRARTRATEGDARSQALVGLVYEMGAADIEPNPKEAMSWFLKAAGQGSVWAKVWAGDFYYTGSPGVPRDMYKAIELYKEAAEAGDPRGAFLVGQMYFFGDGVLTNQREAAGWLRRGAVAEPQGAALASLAEVSCDTEFCTSLRQVLGAMIADAPERFAGEWDDAVQEWDAVQELPDSERCGFTSSDRTEDGDIRNYFCDSEVIDDTTRGVAAARKLAAQVEEALPRDWVRSDGPAQRGEPAVFFTKEGQPRLRVSYNTTPGAAPGRVTLLIGR